MARVNMRYFLALAIIIMRRRRKRKRLGGLEHKCERRFCVSEMNQKHTVLGALYSALLPARIHDRFSFFRYVRMSPDPFDHLLSLVQNNIKKQHKARAPVPPNERLAATLRYLASGDSKQSTSFQFKLGKSTVAGIIDEVCEAMWDS